MTNRIKLVSLHNNRLNFKFQVIDGNCRLCYYGRRWSISN